MLIVRQSNRQEGITTLYVMNVERRGILNPTYSINVIKMLLSKDKILDTLMDKTEVQRIWDKLETHKLIITKTDQGDLLVEWRKKPEKKQDQGKP